MKAFILAIVTVFTLSGCGVDNISLVKGGVFDDHQQTTVGRAFDAWQACDMGVTWETFETASGINIVEYKCMISETKKKFARGAYGVGMIAGMKSEKAANNYLNTMCSVMGRTDCNINVEDYPALLATPYNVVLQFTMNLDDTFEATYIGVSMGSAEASLASQGVEPGAWVGLIMNDESIPDVAFNAHHLLLAGLVPAEDLAGETEGKAFLGI